MPLLATPVSARTAPYDPRVTANGSYTLPQYAYIPNPQLQQLATGMVAAPGAFVASAAFAAPPGINSRPYPTPSLPIYGIRTVLNYKTSPG